MPFNSHLALQLRLLGLKTPKSRALLFCSIVHRVCLGDSDTNQIFHLLPCIALPCAHWMVHKTDFQLRYWWKWHVTYI